MIRAALCFVLLLCLVACGTVSTPATRGSAQNQAAGATAAATDKRQSADAAQTDAAKADALAMVAEKTEQNKPTPELIAAAAKLRADAIVAQAVAKVLEAQANRAEQAATTAATRASTERAAEQTAAAELADQERTNRDRRWAIIGLALCAVAGVALRVLGIPSLISLGIPAAVTAGCMVLIAWTSVPWLAVLLGWTFAAVVLVIMVMIIRTVIIEWIRYADHLSIAMPEAKTAADDASRAMQSPIMAWVIDHILRRFGG